MVRESELQAPPGLPMVLFLLIVHALLTVWGINAIIAESLFGIITSCTLWSLMFVLWGGLFIVNPNEARVMQLFGKYSGTVKASGLRWANPFFLKPKISLRVRNFETGKLKVNDNNGNPIEIGTVVVWKVVDTAEALFEVDDYVNFVHVQSESALRNLATSYPYEAHDGEVALRSNPQQIAEELNMPTGTVTKQLSRAYAKLRQFLIEKKEVQR